MFLQWLYPPLPIDALRYARALQGDCAAPSKIANEDRDETTISFAYDAGCDQNLSAAVRASFEADFRQERRRLNAWCAHAGWIAPALPALQASVSPAYKISRALVPAWNGKRGFIEFPAWRVAARKAAIVHELVHVYFPNGNRLSAEGLAIYLQDLLGGNPAFPNFGRPLHQAARERLSAMVPGFRGDNIDALNAFHLRALDAVPTPNPLTLDVAGQFRGEEKEAQAGLYAAAGSFVQFLIESGGLAKFRELYERTPLYAGTVNAGTPGRWLDVYGNSLADLEDEWKSRLAGALSPLKKEQRNA